MSIHDLLCSHAEENTPKNEYHHPDSINLSRWTVRAACISFASPFRTIKRFLLASVLILGLSASSIVATTPPAEAANAGSCVVAAVTLWPEGGAARAMTKIRALKASVGVIALFNDFNSCYKWIADSNPSAPPAKYDFCAGHLIVSNGLAWKVDVPCQNAGIYRLK